MSTIVYVALYGGFLVVEHYPAGARQATKAYTVPDARLATPFMGVDQADACAKWASHQLYPPDLRYFALLTPATGGCHG